MEVHDMYRSILAGLAALLALPPQAAFAAENQHTKTFHFEIGPELIGDLATVEASSAKLTRTEDGLSVRINTTELDGGAYTVWWVIFNNVEHCAAWPDGGCNPFVDLGNPDVGGAVFFATGGVVKDNGAGHFRAYLETNFEPADSGDRDKVLISNGGLGLQNPQGAEVHIAMRYHGPAALGHPDLLMKQIETSSGGCNNGSFFVPQDPVPADRLFGCYDPQAAVFLSP
jgi:hypothetical protein